jgi:osmotically-inducible protein OsmY
MTIPFDIGPDGELDDNAQVCQRVRLYLLHSGHQHLPNLDVRSRWGVVCLRGTVPSYYARQLAIACARRVAGVREIDDQIVVDFTSSTDGKAPST